MNVLFTIINRIDSLLNEVPIKLKNYTEDELSFKHSPDEWSKKEILGHLCDSAINNLTRFVRGHFEHEPIKLISYQQDEWVRASHYQEMKINDIVNYWVVINRRIIYLVSKIPEDKLGAQCIMDNTAFRTPGDDKSLLWLFEDYLVHMEHHLKQLGIMN